MKYQEFLDNKRIVDVSTGLNVSSVNPMLFDFQRDITKWALQRGRACCFGDCGLGKTPIQLSWSDEIRKAKGKVLIVAPLAVSKQTVQEGKKFGIELEYKRDGEASKTGMTITNYEMMDRFNMNNFSAVVLDESSILKSYTGKFRTMIIDRCAKTQFRLACTATPAPNDLMELCNHSEFVEAMNRSEMLSMFFVHDGGETQNWRLKGHAKKDFWKWVCSWAVMIRKPSDLGYDDGKFILPPLNLHEIVIESDRRCGGMLFSFEAKTLRERQEARRNSIQVRCQKAAEIANSSDDSYLIWCDRNDESETLASLINDSHEIKGSDKPEYKEKTMIEFSDGSVKRLITKPSIAGFGMNWQHCNKVIFVGLSDSYEQFYQAVRRSWRFGQTKPVDCYIITSSEEGAVVENIKRKEKQAQEMAMGMVENMHVYNEENVRGTQRGVASYAPNQTMRLPEWLEGVA